MSGKYNQNALLFKAFADTNRLMIVDMLSCGELCACKILEGLGITQPTLSHHMKILCGCGLVNSRKDGKWTHYSLNGPAIHEFKIFLNEVTCNKENCICGESQ
jgi:ArsR family transcriptional regulator